MDKSIGRKDWLKTVIEASPDAIVVTDLEGNILECNQVAFDMSGFDFKEEVINFNIINFAFSEDNEKAVKDIENLLLNGLIRNREYTISNKKGKVFPIEISAGVIFDDSGKSNAFVAIIKDITERKKVEEELRESEQRYYTLFESMTEAFMIGEIILDKKGKVNDWKYLSLNRIAASGYGMKPKKIVNKRFRELFPDIEPPYLKEIGEAVLEDKILKNIEMKSPVTGNWLEVDIYPQGKNTFAVFTRTINERKKVEEKLKESEQWFRSVVDTSPSLLFILNANGEFIYVSPNAKEISGYTPEEFIEKNIWFVHPDDKPRIEKLFKNSLTTGKAIRNVEFKSVKKNGEEWWVSTFIKPIENEKRTFKGFVAQLFDITERKKVEKEIRKSIIYNRELIESSLDPMVTIGPDGKITDVNSATKDITGHSREQLIGTDFSDYFTEPEKARNGYKSVFEDGIVRNYELEIKHKDGFKTPVSYNASVYKDENGEVIGVFAAARDITERKVAEKALKNAHDNLEIKVKERTKELEEAYKSARNIEEKLIEAQQIAHIGNWDLDLKNNKLWLSDEIYRILGYESNKIDRSLLDNFNYAFDIFLNKIVHPDDKIYVEKMFKEIKTTNVSHKIDIRVIKPDGEERTVNGNYNLVLDDDETPIRIHGTIQDVTERKNVEKKLKESEAYYRTIFENTGTATFIIEEDFTISLMNAECEEISGYSKDEVEGKIKWQKLVSADCVHKMEDFHNLRRVNPELVPKNYEFTFIDKFGNIKYVSSTVDIIPGTKKTVVSLLDITDKKIAENTLKESKAQLRIAMDLAKIVSWEYDVESDMFTFDDHFYALYGTTAEEEGGAFMSSEEYAQRFLPPKEAHLVGKAVVKAIEMDDPNYIENIEHSIIRADGEKRYIIVRFGLIKDDKGRTIKTYGANQDITELKRSENELIRSNERFKAVMDSLDAIVYVADMDTYEVLFVNEYTRQLFGDIEGTKCWKSIQIGQTSPCPFCTNKWLLNENRHPNDVYVWEFQNTITKRWYECRDSAIRWVDGRLVRMEVATDITDRKKLENKYIERSKSLENLVKELKRSNEELEQFAYITSHDLQEPLRTIASFTQLLERRYKGKFDSDADDFMEYMVEASIRMKEMIQGLLNYSRIGKERKELKTVNLENVINETLSDLKLIIEENDALITHDSLPSVAGDSKLLVQLFQNLISNAIKFKKPEEPPKIHISATKREKDNKYVICVEDKGIGIEPQYTDKIFKVFKRLHTISEYRGVGIGLAISRRIVDIHGGQIWVESEIDKGSKFCFTLNPAKNEQ